jgi:hypothetical protein
VTRVAGDKALDFDGMKQQVKRAIEIYEAGVAGRPIETNIDARVDAALAKARIDAVADDCVPVAVLRLAAPAAAAGRRGRLPVQGPAESPTISLKSKTW